MSKADAALGFFTACNLIRVLAYFPQILTIGRDAHGASSISFTTWSLFGVANASTSIYAAVVLADVAVAAMFAASALCCATILVLTGYKRLTYRKALQPNPAPRETLHQSFLLFQMRLARPGGRAAGTGEGEPRGT